MSLKPYIYVLTIAYDGTNYSGWQRQPHLTSIQEVIEKAIQTITREKVPLIGSSRTDAGVHALDQVAHFRTSKEIDTGRLFKALNGLLPPDIRILQIKTGTQDFHAQKNAQAKIYHYHITTKPFVMPSERLYTTHIRKEIDLALLEKAAKKFVGTHDFTSFANKASEGAASKNAVRTIFRIDVVTTKHGFRLEFEGSGFLYKMVRNIVGMLLEVASHKRPFEEIDSLFKAKNRRLAPTAAPAQGLFLVKVVY
ncbi:MAG TPA: tRNA pseudouridine(38-40) synthase TruA [Chlamydiales bacterium]|nr:tRNA pseudouridine(38-40) synthase TruA [Chlamydiales bacterium]